MKIMFLNKAHTAKVHLGSQPCPLCMYYRVNCRHIPSKICVLYGGFQTADEKIFEI